jgi:sulfonate transport system permease protein
MSVPLATSSLSRRLRGLVLPLALMAGWEAASRSGLPGTHLLPSLLTVAERSWQQFAGAHLLDDIAASLARTLLGFAIGSVLGLIVGLAFGLSRIAERLIGPTFDALKQIALFAWIPLISVWFGVGETAKIAFIALAAFTPMVVNAWEGARGIDKHYVEVARVLTFSRSTFIWRVVLPGALPSIFVGLHLSLIYAWLATVGAEYFMTTGAGIGSLMMDERERYHMDLVLMCMAVLGIVGLLLNQAAARLEARLLRRRHL